MSPRDGSVATFAGDGPDDGRFDPPRLLRGGHRQSILASLPPRRLLVARRTVPFERASRPCVVSCGRGVRLLGLHARAPADRRGRGLVVMIHGWEGSARSAYLRSCGSLLWTRGFDVFRLNLRDHGESHHLNPGVFHSCRLDEVVGAVREIAARTGAARLALVGFSLGGNFALRVALRAGAGGPRPWHVVAVSPAIDPAHVLQALEREPRFYERYFLRKWRRSLRLKQRSFPGLYDFAEWRRLPTLREATRYLVERFTTFRSLEEYLAGYSIGGRKLAGLNVPATLVTAADDPVVPVSDVLGLQAPSSLRLEVERFGGHCAFLDGVGSTSWIDRRVLAILGGDEGAAGPRDDRPPVV